MTRSAIRDTGKLLIGLPVLELVDDRDHSHRRVEEVDTRLDSLVQMLEASIEPEGQCATDQPVLLQIGWQRSWLYRRY